jgi:hypothetical protein
VTEESEREKSFVSEKSFTGEFCFFAHHLSTIPPKKIRKFFHALTTNNLSTPLSKHIESDEIPHRVMYICL